MSFEPLQSLLGGALMGLAILMLIAVNRRSSEGALAAKTTKFSSSYLAFVVGVAAAPLVYLVLADPQFLTQLSKSTSVLIVGGVIAGLGLASFVGNYGSPTAVTGRLVKALQALTAFLVAYALTVLVINYVKGR